MPFIDDMWSRKYSSGKEQRVPCECGSNNSNCDMCNGTGVVRTTEGMHTDFFPDFPVMDQEEVDKEYKGDAAWLNRSTLGSKKTAELAREMECASCGDPMFYSMSAQDNDPPSPTTPRCEECKKPMHQQCSAIRPGFLCFQCFE